VLNVLNDGASTNSVPIIVATCVVLPVFWLRDYMALRMSPSRRATHRALAYGTGILVAAALFWALGPGIGLIQFVRLIESPAILFLLIALQIAACLPSIWIKQSQSYHWMWATALLPAPIPWFLLLESTLVSENILGTETAQFGYFAVAVLWSASMIAVILRVRDIQMSVDDLDFAVFFGSVSHWLAICAIPLAFSMG
jgi:hypothetical protein